MTPEQRRERGQKVETLLRDETFQSVAAAVDAHYRDAVFRTKLADLEKREAAFAEYAGFRAMLEKLRSWAQDGQMAADELAHDRA